MSNILQYTKEEAIEYVSRNGYHLHELNSQFKKDKDVVLAAINAHLDECVAFSYADISLKYDKDFMMKVLEQKPMTLEYFEEVFRDNIHIVSKAVSLDAYTIQYASPRLKAHKRVIHKALQENEEAVHFIDSAIAKIIGVDEPLKNLEKYMKAEKLAQKLNKIMPSNTSKSTKIKI